MAESSLEAQCKARIGTTLKGKWLLEGLLGVGGMAAVYVGAHKIGRREAIKILHPEVARSAELRARFQREALATNAISHPGAVEVRDADETEDGCPFLVMELLEGETLGQRATRLSGMPVDELLAYTDELLDVLAVAHDQGIVHRDIKLDNLFVTNEQRLKVLDFGIAHMRLGPTVTRVGARLGTTAYMAPEQVRGTAVDGRADLFAVGATMFRLLAKRRIHEAANDGELVTKMATLPAPGIETLVPGIAPGLAAIINRALRFERDERYPDARSMQADVRRLRGAGAGAGATSPRAAGQDVPTVEFADQSTAFGNERTEAPASEAFTAHDPTGYDHQGPASRAAQQQTVALQTPLPGSLMVAPPQPNPASPAYGFPTALQAGARPHPSDPPPASAMQPWASAGAGTPNGFATPAFQQAPSSPKKSSKAIWVVGLMFVALGAIGATGYLAFSGSARSSNSERVSAADGETEDESADDEAKQKRKAKRKAEAESNAAAAAAPAQPSALPTSTAEALASSPAAVNPADPGPMEALATKAPPAPVNTAPANANKQAALPGTPAFESPSRATPTATATSTAKPNKSGTEGRLDKR